MNKWEDLISDITSWTVVSSSQDSIVVSSPMPLYKDNQLITFTIIFPTENTFFLTDFAEHVMHASTYGISLDKRKLSNLNTSASFAQFDLNGEIIAEGDLCELRFALFDALRLAVNFSLQYSKWFPKFNALRFKTFVKNYLIQELGNERIIFDYKATGISGLQRTIPFAIKNTDAENLIFIDSIALGQDKRPDWNLIFPCHGKFSDIKRFDSFNERVVFFEAGASEQEFGSAATFLSDVASIRLLSPTSPPPLEFRH